MKFEIVDTTGKVDAALLAAYATAQQRQLREHYAVCFDGDGDSDEVSLPRVGFTPDMVARIENGGTGDMLGFHELGVLHAFADLAQSTGTSLTGILSHEVLEARRDPRLHTCIELDDGSIWDCEICDRVEADSYTIDGILLSNFNTPECFEPPPNLNMIAIIAARGGKGGAYDWMDLSNEPNQIRPGGYAQKKTSTGWQIQGQMRAYRLSLYAKGMGRTARRAAR